jgi:hypothetical protein
MGKKKWHLVFLIGALSYMALIFFMSSQSNISVPLPSFRYKDKFAHCIEYSILASLIYLCLRRFSSGQQLFWAIVGSSLYGLSDEIHQSFVPGRHADYADLIADFVGSLIGAFGAKTASPYLFTPPDSAHQPSSSSGAS